MPAKIHGFSHINLLVTDLDRARWFYRDVLGFEELPRPGVSGTGAWFRVGDLQLHLSGVETMPPPPEQGVPHIALYVPTDALASTVEAIRDAGADVRRDVSSREDFGVPVLTAFCADPDGNVIELTDVGPL